jgi:hypothetical protein
MVRYYILVESIGFDTRYYGEHPDGTAFLTTSRQSAKEFSDRRTANILASTVSGAKVRAVYDDGWRAPKEKAT